MALVLFGAPVACGLTTLPPALGGGEDTTSGETGAGPGASSSGSSTAAQVPGSSSDESDGDPPSNFLGIPDAGPDDMCDPWTQNCPEGEKCVYWANDGGSSWNATKCTEIAPDPDEVGEPCTVEGNGVSGIDTCVQGAMCWDVDPKTNEGVCVGLCSGDESNPVCLDPEMRCVGRGPVLCLPTCCPVEQDCIEGQGCYPDNDDFSCLPDASGAGGGYGDSCEYINACDPGLACVAPTSIPACGGGVGCCTAFCEVGSASCSLLHPELECTPWFEEGASPPGLEHIGVCATG